MKSEEGQGNKNTAKAQPLSKPAAGQEARTEPQRRTAHTPRREPLVYDQASLPPLPHETRGEAQGGRTRKTPASGESRATKSSEKESFSILLWLSLASLLGLAIGITLAILLASGELDLSLKDVKQIFKSFNF